MTLFPLSAPSRVPGLASLLPYGRRQAWGWSSGVRRSWGPSHGGRGASAWQELRPCYLPGGPYGCVATNSCTNLQETPTPLKPALHARVRHTLSVPPSWWDEIQSSPGDLQPLFWEVCPLTCFSWSPGALPDSSSLLPLGLGLPLLTPSPHPSLQPTPSSLHPSSQLRSPPGEALACLGRSSLGPGGTGRCKFFPFMRVNSKHYVKIFITRAFAWMLIWGGS